MMEIGITVASVVLFDFKYNASFSKYNFPLLSDFNKEVSQAYGAIYDSWILNMKGVSKRSAFVVDKDGVIRYAEVLESAGDIPDFDKIKEVLDGLQ